MAMTNGELAVRHYNAQLSRITFHRIFTKLSLNTKSENSSENERGKRASSVKTSPHCSCMGVSKTFAYTELRVVYGIARSALKRNFL